MRVKMTLPIVALLGFALSSASGLNEIKARPIPIENSRSPDGGIEITITATGGADNDGEGRVEVRRTLTGECIGSFDWEGCEDQVSEKSFQVSWRPDSGAFALSYRATRHHMGCQIWLLTSHRRCLEFRLPDLDARTIEKDGLRAHPRGDVEFVKWLPDGRLELTLADAYADSRDGVLTLRIPDPPRDGEPLLLVLESIRPDPRP